MTQANLSPMVAPAGAAAPKRAVAPRNNIYTVLALASVLALLAAVVLVAVKNRELTQDITSVSPTGEPVKGKKHMPWYIEPGSERP